MQSCDICESLELSERRLHASYEATAGWLCRYGNGLQHDRYTGIKSLAESTWHTLEVVRYILQEHRDSHRMQKQAVASAQA